MAGYIARQNPHLGGEDVRLGKILAVLTMMMSAAAVLLGGERPLVQVGLGVGYSATSLYIGLHVRQLEKAEKRARVLELLEDER